MPEVISLGEPMVEFCAMSKGSLKSVEFFERGWGGDVSNVVVAVSRLGHRSGIMCRVGDDEFGECFLEMWRSEGVDTSRVIVEKGAFTAVYFISIRDDGGHDFTYYRANSAASHFSPEDLDLSYISEARILHVSGITQAISSSCREAVFKAIEAARGSGVLVSYDPNIRLKLWSLNLAKAVVSYTIGMVDFVLLTRDEAKLITGMDDVENAALKILGEGPKIVALKLGVEGCIIVSDNGIFKAPAYRVEIVDTTGAGDAFDAAFMVGVLENMPLQRIAYFANVAAALKCRGRGAVKPLPYRWGVDEVLSRGKI
jgi:2-dehydro-3-deoxygluconokinase